LRKLSSGIREEIDDAIATELGHPESLSKAVELKDIGWALAGIAVDAVGIVVQLCALTQYLRLACAGFKVPLTGAPGMATPPSARP
jgi:hypothetical protein